MSRKQEREAGRQGAPPTTTTTADKRAAVCHETRRMRKATTTTAAAAVMALLLPWAASAFLIPAASRSRPTTTTTAAPPPSLQPAQRYSAVPALSAVPTLLHQLQSEFPRVPLPPDFLDGAPLSDTGADMVGAATDDGEVAAAANDRKQREELALVRARMLAGLAPRALLARGLDIISEDFTFFSPSTGPLSRSEYMGLVGILERALPDLRQSAAHFRVVSLGGGGVVSFVSRARGAFTGELCLGDSLAPVPGTGAKYQGEVELSVVAFDAQGLLQSLSTGVVVPAAAIAADKELEAAVAGMAGEGSAGEEDEQGGGPAGEMRVRLEAQAQKLATTPEGTAAWEKIRADMEATQQKLDAFQQESELIRTAGGYGGLGGVLFALGIEHAGPLPSALGAGGMGSSLAELDDITMELDLISLPSECETLIQETAQWADVLSSGSGSGSTTTTTTKATTSSSG